MRFTLESIDILRHYKKTGFQRICMSFLQDCNIELHISAKRIKLCYIMLKPDACNIL